MSVLIVTHPSSHLHVTPPGHPERVARIETVDRVLASAAYAGLPRAEAPEASEEQITRAHLPAYLAMLKMRAPKQGWTSLDPDTHMCPDSLQAARHAAGSNIAAVDAVLGGAHKAAFCAVRPCGHHAERDRAMGFCLFNNVAVGAHHALAAGVERLAIVDFDVHHGNGTQDIFWEEPRVQFISSHQMPLYPGSGSRDEIGVGNILNVPLAPMTGGREMRTAYEGWVFPALRAFQPELLMISAGFDAHAADPLANLNWREADFGWVTAELCRIAAELCDGRVVSTLEGGYDLDGLAGSLAAHLDALIAHAEAQS
ncbi:MAG TPA: histone deacetylase family protein [Thermohalobaculum sp.]|nr:histone deacetylase family protein [Thermohalobaculum sp.]